MRMNVYVPDALAAKVRAELPGVNVSRVVQDALSSKLGCTHDLATCDHCTAPLRRLDLIDEALGRFYSDAQWALGELVSDGGTAEGAQRVLKRIGDQYGLDAKVPLRRPTRVERQRALDRRLAELPPVGRAVQKRRAARESATGDRRSA